MSNEWKGNKICRRRRIMEFVLVHQEKCEEKAKRDAVEENSKENGFKWIYNYRACLMLQVFNNSTLNSCWYRIYEHENEFQE